MIYETLFIRHSDISDDLLSKIYDLKAVRWNYDVDQQKEWIQKNVFADDYHLMIMEDQQIVAYTNLINIKVIINGDDVNVKGVGNVCTLKSGFGLGNILMEQVNKIILKYDSKGMLLCNDYLVGYYQKFSWKLIDKSCVTSNFIFDVNFMLFNFDKSILSLDYNDRNF